MSPIATMTLCACLRAIIVLLARSLQEIRALRRAMWDVARLLQLLERFQTLDAARQAGEGEEEQEEPV